MADSEPSIKGVYSYGTLYADPTPAGIEFGRYERPQNTNTSQAQREETKESRVRTVKPTPSTPSPRGHA